MEWKRIYHLGTWLLFLLLFAVQAALYASQQTKAVQLTGEAAQEWEETEDGGSSLTLDSVHRAYRAFLAYAKELGADSPQGILSCQEPLEAYRQKLGEDGEWAYGTFSRQVEKKQNYREVMQSILDNAGQISGISIFQKDSASSEANRKRTVRDFQNVLEVEWELSPTYAFTSVLAGQETVFLLLLWTFCVVWQFGAERKLGLWGMLYQTAGGRGRLAGKRVAVLAGSTVFAVALFYGSLLVAAMLRYGGAEGLSAPVQMIDAFYRVPYRIPVWQMIVVYLVCTALGLFLTGLLLWLCLTLFMNRTLSVLAFLAIMAGEYLCYTQIGNRSVLALLYHMNLFHLLFPYNWMTEYLNYAAFGVAIPRYVLIAGFAVGASLLVTGLLVLLNERLRPVFGTGLAERALRVLGEWKNRILEWLPMQGKELYKLLIHQKAWLFLALVLYVTLTGYKVSGVVYGSAYGNTGKEFYDTCSGPLGKDAYAYRNMLEEQIRGYSEEEEKAREDFAAGLLSMSDYSNRLQFLTDQTNKTGELYDEVSGQIQYLEELEKKGIHGWVLDERGYETMLGKRNYRSQLTLGLVTVLTVLLTGAVLFSQEEQAGMKSLLRSAKGRDRLAVRKYLVMTGMAALVWCCSYALNLWNMCAVYKLSDFKAPVQSIRYLADFPLRISVGGFLCWLYGLRFLWLVLMAFLAMFFSRKCGYYQSILLSALLLLPHMLCLLGLKALRGFSAVYPPAFLQQWADYGNTVWLWLPYAALLALGIFSILPWSLWRREK